jgi:multidrug resistance efflux pump
VLVVLAAGAAALVYFWPFGPRTDELRLQGIVEIQEVRLGSKVAGRVERLGYNPRTHQLIKEGDVVEKDQELVAFEVPELTAQRAQWYARVQADRAALDRARTGPRPQEREAGWAAFLATQAKLERMTEGWREEEKRQARNELAAAKAELTLATEEFERIRKLYPQSASQSEYDTARSGYRRADARYEAARARKDMLEAGNRQEDINEAIAAWLESWN